MKSARKASTGDAPTLHARILADIEGKIVSGAWPPGHRLPFELDLAKSYDVSRMTVNKVLTGLAQAGLIERRRKFGTIVARPRAQSAILEIHDIESDVRALGLDYAVRLVSRVQRPATLSERAEFGLKGKGRVLALRTLHLASDAPFCFEVRRINLAVVPQAASADFTVIAPGPWLMREVPWISAEHRIHAAAADAPLARRLAIPRGAPCLVMERRTWSSEGPVTRVHFFYPADKHTVVARFTPTTLNT